MYYDENNEICSDECESQFDYVCTNKKLAQSACTCTLARSEKRNENKVPIRVFAPKSIVRGKKTHVQHVAHVRDIEMNALKQNPSAGIKLFLMPLSLLVLRFYTTF